MKPRKPLTKERKGSLYTLIAAAVAVCLALLLKLVMPDFTGQPSFGIYSLIPALFLILYIFFTKRIFEALILASLIGYIMVAPFGKSVTAFSTGLMEVMMSKDIAWLFLVCGLMGSIIAMVEKAGGAWAFGQWVAKKAATKNSVLIWTWLMGIILFLDDYLNALVIGSCMAPQSDRHRTPREMLAFIVDSTAAPACVLIPISSWGVFCGQLMETNRWAPEGQGLLYFIKTIPFNFYAWIGILIVPFFILNIIKPFGPMKKAYERVEKGGPVAPPGSERVDVRGGKKVEKPDNPRIINFFIPIISMIVFALIPAFISGDLGLFDMPLGVYGTLAVCFILYLAQGVMTASEYWNCFITGIKNMLGSLILMVLAFLFAKVNEKIGFTYYMIEISESLMTPHLMPVVVFVVLSITELITGTNWGMYVIALPIVIPLAQKMGVNVALAVSAVISAGVFGSHICFYSDATVITSAATGCDNFAHARTQIPYGLLSAGITVVLYLIAGFIF